MSEKIKEIFSEVPKTYELVNHVLSLGLDIYWRRRLARHAASFAPRRCMDICSGAGYKYLSNTIPRFYPAPELAQLLRDAGFRYVEVQSPFLGAAAIHTAVK